MRLKIIILFLTVSINVVGQKYVFSPTGIMEHSQLYVDTLIKTKLKPTNKVVFIYFDSSYRDNLNFKQYFPKKYDKLLQDTCEYFFVANLTGKSIHFKRLNKRLIAEEFSRYENFGFKPISYFMYPFCALQYDSLILKPSEILVIKSLTRRKTLILRREPNSFMKILTTTNGVLFSARYEKAIGNSSFYINSTFEKDFNLNRRKLAFKDE